MDDGKVCTTCNQWRPLGGYNRWARAKDGHQARCRDCCRIWYAANRVSHKANTSRRAREAREEYHRRVVAYLEQHPCVDCGETDVVVLEFDHREAGSKVREVARLINALVAWAKVEAEIAKCDVCCANCHRRRTARRGEQRRYRYQVQRQADTDAALLALFVEVMTGP